MEGEAHNDSDEAPSTMSMEEVKIKVEEYRARGLEAVKMSEALREETEDIEKQQEALRLKREEMLTRRAELMKLRDEMVRKGLEMQLWFEGLLSTGGPGALEREGGLDGKKPGEGDEDDEEARKRRGEEEGGDSGEGPGKDGEGRKGHWGPDGTWIDDDDEWESDGEGGWRRKADGQALSPEEEEERRRLEEEKARRALMGLDSSSSDEEGLDWNEKKAKRFLHSLMQHLKELMMDETRRMVEGLVAIIDAEAERIVEEHGDEDRDWKALGEAYQRVMMRHAKEMGEEYQRKVLERCYLRAVEDMEMSDELSAEFRRIAQEEYDSLAERFEVVVRDESARLLAGRFSVVPGLDPSAKWCDVGRRTLAIIKPDAYAFADQIIYEIQGYGFAIVQQRRIRLTPEQASLFYGDHLTKAFSRRLIEHMSSGPIVVLCLGSAHCPSTVHAWRERMGPTDVTEAMELFPDTLRAKYGDPNNQVRNAFHGSHTLEDAEREIHFFFPNMIVDPLPNIQDMTSILDEKSLKVLEDGLITLCKEKPDNTLSWFAHWLKHRVPGGASKTTGKKATTHFLKY
ncbi:thioredoxin domain-containing protein 3 homolog isoform X2 [Ischnura elegans]|uniref:thioredoxin domain-containing protein 3 homolog isoform X2 n=1 Tax=Ischnura elegans TaxID=197161 RepID=UPI001ED896B2|nr:thioredoxin domain-containing protein 3 homolog isoform X2 [Ischnura elegans]